MNENIMQSLLDTQHKMLEYWTHASKKMMESVYVPQDGESKKEEPVSNWWEWQKSLFGQSPAAIAFPGMIGEAPEQFRQWMELQSEFNQKWWDSYRKAMSEVGYTWPDKDTFQPLRLSSDFWKDWMEHSQNWLEEKNWKEWPNGMNKSLGNYAELYNLLYKYWEPFSKLIEHGIYDKDVVEKYFSREAFQNLMNKAFNITPSDKWSDMLEKSNDLVEYYIEFLNEFAPTLENTMIVWDRFVTQFTPTAVNPMFKILMDINHYMREMVDPFYTLAGPKKEIQALQLMREVHFNYTSFLIKTAELQGRVIEASHLTLPRTLEDLTEEYKTSKRAPDFNTFFKTFLNNLEDLMVEVLESDHYSKLQNQVAKTGVEARAKLDKLMELFLQGIPVVTRSEEDDIARELHALREKVMRLEGELKAVKEVKKKKGKELVSEN
jgi:hypothetical protein